MPTSARLTSAITDFFDKLTTPVQGAVCFICHIRTAQKKSPGRYIDRSGALSMYSELRLILLRYVLRQQKSHSLSGTYQMNAMALFLLIVISAGRISELLLFVLDDLEKIVY